jgi:hypothetical protein
MSYNGSNADVAEVAQLNPNQGYGAAPGQSAHDYQRMAFGPPNVKEINSFGRKVSRTHEDLSEAYRNRTAYFADSIVGLVVQNPEWITSVLPWLQTEEQHFKWRTIRFDRAAAGPTPAEGISRLLSHRQEEYAASTTRYGIAFRMEHDMLASPEGRDRYKQQLAQMVQACRETVYYEALFQLLNCKAYRQKQQSAQRIDLLDRVFDLEAQEFGILVSNREGFARVVERHRLLMQAREAVPDTLIVHPLFTYFENFISRGSYSEYHQTGPDGAIILTAGIVSNGTYRNMPIYEVTNFGQYENGMVQQPLASMVSVGEYYPVTFEAFRHASLGRAYNSKMRDIGIYDIATDEYRKITFLEMLRNAHIFGGDPTNRRGLSLDTHEHCADLNAAFAADDVKANAEFEPYAPENLSLLEAAETNAPSRSIYMFLSHGPDNRLYTAETMGELDVDVMSTFDAKQAALGMLYSALSPAAESSMAQKLDSVLQFVETLEQMEPNDDFFRALSNENLSRSVDSTGIFVGRESKGVFQARDFAPNAFGGLDLPTYSAAYGQNLGGIATYPMIATLAAQGQVRGYPETLYRPAKEVVAAIRFIYEEFHAKFPQSKLWEKNEAPEWIHLQREQAAIFAAITQSRPPIFLGVSAVGAGILKKGGGKWKAGKALSFTTLKSQSRILGLSVILSNASKDPLDEKRVADYLANAKSSTYYKKFEELAKQPVGKEKTDAIEKLLDSSFAMLRTASQTPYLSIVTLDTLKDAISKLDADKFVENVDTVISDASAKISATKKAKAQDDQKATAASIQTLLDGSFEVSPAAKVVAGAPVFAAASISEFDAFMNTASFEGHSATNAETMQTFADQIELLKLQLEPLAKQPYVFGREAEFVAELSRRQVDAGKIADFQKYATGMARLIENAKQSLGANLQTNVSFGNEVEVDQSKFTKSDPIGWFRAPLAMTPLIYRVEAQRNVAAEARTIKVANKRDHYRTYVEYIDGDAYENEDLPELVNGKPDYEKKRIADSAAYRSMLPMSAVVEQHPNLNVGFAGRSGEDAPQFKMRQLADGTFTVGNQAEVESQMRAISSSRQKRSLPERDFTVDFAMAQDQLREQNRGAQLGFSPFGNPNAAQASYTEKDEGGGDMIEKAMRALSSKDGHGHSQKRKKLSQLQTNAFNEQSGAPQADPTERPLVHPNVAYRMKKAAQLGLTTLEYFALMVFLKMPMTSASWEALIKANVPAPINFLLWRLHIQIEMYQAILMQSGQMTGANVIGNTSLNFTPNGVDKTFHAHLTFNHVPLIYKEENVAIIRNTAPSTRGYVAGWDTRWIMSTEEFMSQDRGSLIVTPIAITENISARRLDFVDTTKPSSIPRITNRTKTQTDLPSHSGAAMAEKKWQISALARQEQSFGHGEVLQVRASRGEYLTWSQTEQRLSFLHEGTGHLSGNRTGPGVQKVWMSTNSTKLPDLGPHKGKMGPA